MNKERPLIVRRAVLTELAHTPRGYMQTQATLCSSVSLAVCPEPTDSELDDALARLEADCLAVCVVDALGCKRWQITAAGRAALQA